MQIFSAFAMTGTHAGIPYRPSTPEEAWLMEQVARAMEVFAIAHEYGHHHLDHGRSIEADPHLEEFEADQFALRISYEVEKKPVSMQNPYLLSGAGGLILLLSLDVLREVEAFLGAAAVDRSTHPSVTERAKRFDSVSVLFPKEFAWLKGFRMASIRIMTCVHETVSDTFAETPTDILIDMKRQRREIADEDVPGLRA